MSRVVGLFAVLGLLLLPDWATALGWRARRAYRPPPVPVVAPACEPVPIVIQPGAYAPAAPGLAPPTVHVVPGAAAVPPPREAPKATATPADTGVRPAAAAQEPGSPKLATPTPAPAPPEPARTNPEFLPARPPVVDPPAPARPAEEQPGNKVPKLDLPLVNPNPPAAKPPEAKPENPKADPPKVELPPVPGSGSGAKADTPPPIVLPQLPPIVPTGGLSESRYRPAAADRPAVSILPAEGSAPAGGNRKVGFYNYTSRDLDLHVAGKAVKLPARSYVTAEVPAAFTWRVGTGADETTAVPTGSPGVEIVLK